MKKTLAACYFFCLTGCAASCAWESSGIFPLRISGLKMTSLYLTLFSLVLVSHILLTQQNDALFRKCYLCMKVNLWPAHNEIVDDKQCASQHWHIIGQGDVSPATATPTTFVSLLDVAKARHIWCSYLRWSTVSFRVTIVNTTLALLFWWMLLMAVTTPPSLCSAAVMTTGISSPFLAASGLMSGDNSDSKGRINDASA